MNPTVIIEYRTSENYCNCCNRKLDKPKVSEVREFEVSKENITDYFNGCNLAEYQEDLDDIVEEYVHDTISFFATSSYEKIIIENSEFDKVKQLILNEIIN